MKLYVLQGLGFGDDEDTYENIGIFSSMAELNEAKQSIINDGKESDDDDYEPEFRVEKFVLNQLN